MSGPKAPHLPTLPWVVVIALVLIVTYHVVFHRGK